jgi:thermitase
MKSRFGGTRHSASSRRSTGARKKPADFPSVVLLTAALLAAPISATMATTSATAEPIGWAKGRILVQPVAGLSEEAFADILARRGGRSVSHNQRINLHIVQVPLQAEWAIAKTLSKNPLIAFAEPDMLVEPSETIPDDPQFPNQWHLSKIQAPTAWDMGTGDGITVAILDDGVDPDHPDLEGRLVSGWNAVSLNEDTAPVNVHGTRVAGVVAAETNNAIGVASSAYGAHLMPVRVTNSSNGYAYDSDIARGLTWAADHGAQVANISYDVTNSEAVSSAAQYMRNQGGVVVVAAGNTGGNPGYSDNPYVISVSATTSTDTKASWSSYGDYVDVSAPGVGIVSTNDGGGYISSSGTSMASPIAAGVVALIMGANGALVPSEVESLLTSTADDLGSVGQDPAFGAGRVNAAAAVQAAADMVPNDTQAPEVSIVVPTGGTTVVGWVAVEVNAIDDVGVSRVEFYADGSLVGADLTAPYQFSWDSTQCHDGTAKLTARAFDAAGNRGETAPVTVTIDNTPPTVTILSPTDGASVRGRVTLTAHVGDDSSGAWLSIAVDGQTMCASNSATVSCDWKPGDLRGNHTILAQAEDDAGNTGSAIISVRMTGNAGGVGVRAGQMASNEAARSNAR